MTGLGLGPILSSFLVGGAGYGMVEAACIGFFLASLVFLFVPIAAHHIRLSRREAV
jgi:hypothetical protein